MAPRSNFQRVSRSTASPPADETPVRDPSVVLVPRSVVHLAFTSYVVRVVPVTRCSRTVGALGLLWKEERFS